MKSYSLDLRERVVAACQAGGQQAAVADWFIVSHSFVAKLLRPHRTYGSAASLPLHGGPNVTLVTALTSDGCKRP